jgi:hypothetical protein
MYFWMCSQQTLGSTLILTWIPNSTLKKNPRSIENSPAATRITPRRSPRQEYSRAEYPSSSAESPGLSEASATDTETRITRQHDREKAEGNANLAEHKSFNEVGDHEVNLGNMVNNVRYTPGLRDEVKPRIGTNVNPIHEKRTNFDLNSVGQTNTTLLESETRQNSDETQSGLTSANQYSPKTAARHIRERELRRSGSSNKSVASVEMDGDNLVVVTEEVFDDETFRDVQQMEDGSESVPLCSPKDQLRQTLDKIAAAASKSTAVVNASCANRLRESLDLRLNLNSGSDDIEEKVSDFDFEIPMSNKPVDDLRKSSSSSTSGPDSTPPSPVMCPSNDYSGRGGVWSPSDITVQADDHSFDARHHMTFPENAVNYQSSPTESFEETSNSKGTEQVCGVFSVDLGMLFIVSNELCVLCAI